ncbi:hypothetical protein [Pendulispora albinea]|uniref:Peptidase inhibitor family I36 n=1 Tax=Pendulispora albinea TaxID=2741071 RepID=A0ABZ2MBX9_9BACT
MRNIAKFMTTAASLALAVGAMATIHPTVAQASDSASDAPGAAQALDAAEAQAERGTYEGCPYGAVCIYPQNAGWNNGKPSHVYTKYGAYNLSNMFGVHRFFNNQYGGAVARSCTGYNGTGCEGDLTEYSFIDKDFTPINSITLEQR